MKTKTIIVFALLFAVASGFSQDYYTGRTTVTGNNATYKITRFNPTDLWIENAANTRTGLPNRYANGDLVETFTGGGPALAQGADINQLYRAVRETFTAAELDSLKLSYGIIFIQFTVDGAGNTLEVVYKMFNEPEFRAISPDKFWTLEQKIKQYVKFEYDEDKKKVRLYHSYSIFRFSDVPGDGLAVECTDCHHGAHTDICKECKTRCEC